jgi:3,4-dihydroxy-2-butanone 4-phosphate synthase.
MSALAPITEIIADIKAGKMVILVDEEDRENGGRPRDGGRIRHPPTPSTSWPSTAAA